MRKNIYLLTIVLFFGQNLLFGQSEYFLLANWDYMRKTKGYEKIHDIIPTTNGYIIAVGETLGESYKEMDGLLIVLDANDGERILWKKFGTKTGNESFNAIVQNHDGTFSLAGFSQANPRGEVNGWIVQVDMEGQKLFEATPGNGNGMNEELLDIAINDQGQIMASGKKTVDKTERAWAVQVGNQQIVSEFLVGNTLISSAESLAAATDGNFVLMGNTSRKNSTNQDDIWIMKFSHSGNDVWGGAKYFGGKGFQEGGEIIRTADGGYAIAGTTNTKGEGVADFWLLKLNHSGDLVWDKTYGGHAADVGRSIIELSGGGYAFLGQTMSHLPKAKYFTLNLVLTDASGRELEEETYPIYGGKGNEIAYSVIELPSNDNLAIAGNSETDQKDVYPIAYIGVQTYKTLELPSKTSADLDRFGSSLSEALSFSPAVLMDANSNSFLESNERGYLEIEVTNTQNKDLFNVTAKVTGTGNPTELGYWDNIQLGALKAGQKKKLFVPVYAEGALKGGAYELNINVDVNDTYAASSTAVVKSNQPNPARLQVQGYTFSPSSQPQPGQTISLTVNLANVGGLTSPGMSAYFGLPEGVQPKEAQTKTLPSMRAGESKSISFSFAYDPGFNQNMIDVFFTTRGSQTNTVSERFSLEVKPLNQNVTASTNPSTQPNSRNMGDMMVWMSHDPDEKGSKTFATNNRDVNIKLKILTSRQIERNRISVYVNGNKHQGQKMDEVKLTSEGSGLGRYNYQNKLRLKEGQNKVRVVYHDDEGNDFASEELVFDFSPKDKPNLYVLSIGVKHQDLQYTVKDAKDFASMYGKFRDSKDKRVFRKVEVMEVTADDMTTANNIKAAFIRLGRMNIKDGDLVVIFISSHGKINSSGDFILIPSDYNSELEELYSVNFKEDILKKLRMVDGNKLVFIDACHSGSALSAGSRSMFDAASSKIMNDLIQASSGLEIIASCGDNEYSYEDKRWGNGAFTKSIMEAFSGKTVDIGGGKKITADVFSEIDGRKVNGKDQVITIEELKLFIQQRVPYLVKSTKTAPPTGQNPSNKSTDLLPKEMGIFVVNPSN